MRTSPFRVSSLMIWQAPKPQTLSFGYHVSLEEERQGCRCRAGRFLFGLDNAKVNIKKKLISQFNLHTVVRLPGSVFSPYTSITTNLLFFDNTKPTTETWFYRVDIPSDRKHFSKTKPMELKHFDDCIAWWNDRKEIPDAKTSRRRSLPPSIC